MSKIRKILIIALSFLLMSCVPNALRAKAAINPTLKDDNSSINNFKKTLGKKAYQKYYLIDRNLNNGIYNYLLTSANKIDYNYYNRYSGIRKYFGNIHNLYISNEVTTPDAVNNAPWEKDDSGNDVTQQLYNGRDIYYHLNVTGQLADLYNAAIKAWNSLGVVNLQPTDSNDSHVIQLDGAVNHLDNGQADGLTTFYYYLNEAPEHFVNVKIDIDTEVLNEDNYRQLVVIEHELGHALGFDHDNKIIGKRTSLMYGLVDHQDDPDDYNKAMNEANLVGAKEQHVLMQKYNLPVASGYYEYPLMNNTDVN